ncbi:unnamed protein product [Ectocarpus sp. CCAP 1310/34]|nr:unnamed protein product [Ectocarpus sp. CCAP 1310/34]
MGTTPRMVDFAQVALRDGVLLLRSANDGHRSNGIGPGEYHGVSNGQDPMTKRSYNMRAQSSQVRRERSLSFSGTSSTAKAFLSLASSMARTNPTRSNKEAASCRPDLHLLTRNTYPAPGGVGGRGGDGRSTFPGKERRCVSPASAMLSSLRGRAAAAANGNGAAATFGLRSGGMRFFIVHLWPMAPAASLRRRTAAAPGSQSAGPPVGATAAAMTSVASAAVPSLFTLFLSSSSSSRGAVARHGRQAAGRAGGAVPCHRMAVTAAGGRSAAGGRCSLGQPVGAASPPLRAEPGSSRRKNTTSVSISAPSSPRNSRRSTAKKYAPTTGGITGAVVGGRGGSNGSDASYTFDYFGLAGQRGVWRGLESISAARAEVGIEATKDNDDDQNSNKQASAGGGGGNEAKSAAGETESESGRARGAGGGGAKGRRGGPGSLLPERAPAKGVCSPPKETRDDLHTYYAAVNRTTAALDSTSGSNLPPPPSPRALRQGPA